MAKDPAVLWYFNDWSGGTVTLSRHLKGCYMDLLHAQFNSGHLSLDEIKTVLGSDFGSTWPTLQKKFKVEESTGLYYNSRLIFEIDRRKDYSKSRSQNRNSKKHMSEHMSIHMENEIEIEYEIVFLIIPKNWNKEEFGILLKKWIENRKKKPKPDLARLRVSELIEKFPLWADAKPKMTEAALEGWFKLVYPESIKINGSKPGKYDHEEKRTYTDVL